MTEADLILALSQAAGWCHVVGGTFLEIAVWERWTAPYREKRRRS